MLRRAEEIEEMKRWSNWMTRRLVNKFPVPGTGANIEYSHDNSEPPQLVPTKYGDFNRNNHAKPKRLYNIGNNWRTSTGTARGTYAFVLFPDGTMRVGKKGHEHLAKDYYLLFAGEVTFKNGELLFWNNNSGHYCPHPMLASKVPLPYHKYAPIHRRDSWVIREALKVRSNVGDIARLLGWPVRDVFTAFHELNVYRYGRQW